MQPGPTSPLNIEAIRERYADFHRAVLADGAMRDAWPAIQSADDVPALLAALAEAQRERDDALLLVRSVVFYGTGFIWKRPDGTDLVLDPTEVVMVLSVDQMTEVERLRADAERMRPVVEAAAVYIRTPSLDLSRPHPAPREARALVEAVDTYESQTGGTQ
jgi:hypothetical protein